MRPAYRLIVNSLREGLNLLDGKIKDHPKRSPKFTSIEIDVQGVKHEKIVELDWIEALIDTLERLADEEYAIAMKLPPTEI